MCVQKQNLSSQENRNALTETTEAILTEVRKNNEILKEEVDKGSQRVEKKVQEILQVETLKTRYELKEELARGHEGLDRKIQDLRHEVELMRMEMRNIQVRDF